MDHSDNFEIQSEHFEPSLDKLSASSRNLGHTSCVKYIEARLARSLQNRKHAHEQALGRASPKIITAAQRSPLTPVCFRSAAAALRRGVLTPLDHRSQRGTAEGGSHLAAIFFTAEGAPGGSWVYQFPQKHHRRAEASPHPSLFPLRRRCIKKGGSPPRP